MHEGGGGMLRKSAPSDGLALARVRGHETPRPVRWGATLVGLGAALLTGACAKDEARIPVFPVRGQVNFEGKPAPGAFVVFHPVEDAGDDLRPTGRVGPDGS